MLLNYAKFGLRQFSRQKLQFIMNISGLVLALTTFFLIMLYVQDEYSYDRWLPDADRIYRYESETTNSAGTVRLIRGSALRARRDLESYFPEIESSTRLTDYEGVVSRENSRYFETVWFADPEFFEVFDLRLEEGDKQVALSDKFSILLSRSMVEKYFPDNDPLGQSLTLDGEREYRVVGIFTDIPQNSHFGFDFLVPYDETDSTYGFGYSESWFAFEGYTYFKLVEGVSAESIRNQLPEFLRTYFPAGVLPATVEIADRVRPRMQSLLDIHLSPGGLNNIKPPGNRTVLLAFAAVAILVLAIACINFVSMSVTRSLERVREVAIRKVVGAQRNQLLSQFLCETVMIAVVATVAAVGLVEILLPIYNEFLGKQIRVDYFSWFTSAGIGVVSLIAIGLGSGFYPAQRLAAQQPARALRGVADKPRTRAGTIKSALLVFQFAVSISLVITTAVVVLQQRLMVELDLGFNPVNKLVLRNMNEDFSRTQRDLIGQEIQSLPAVTGVAFSTATPADIVGSGFTRTIVVPGYLDEGVPLYPKSVGPGYFSLYEIDMLVGREFNENIQSDRFFWSDSSGANVNIAPGAVLNASAVSTLGFNSIDQAIGATIVMNSTELQVVGVAADAHFVSLSNAMTPNLYIYSPDDHIALTIAHADEVDVDSLVENLTAIWDSFVPEFPVVIESVESNVSGQYQQERLQLLLMTIFSLLAISITSMGLYALVVQMIQYRRKEISIRKIHGALASQIVQTLSSRFFWPAVISCSLAWPTAWYFSVQYLNGFQYRIELSVPLFLISSLAAVCVIVSTITAKTIDAARANPVDALR